MSKEQVTLTVEGMSCSHCENRVKKSVGELSGVESVKVDLENKKVVIEYNGETVSLAAITETIEDQGYDVVK